VLELFIVASLFQKLSATAVKRGRSHGWGLLAVGGWIGGEVLGLVVGLALDLGRGAYLLGLLGAALGAFGVYRALLALPDLAASDLDLERLTDTFR
jgi:hypothetical protein